MHLRKWKGNHFILFSKRILTLTLTETTIITLQMKFPLISDDGVACCIKFRGLVMISGIHSLAFQIFQFYRPILKNEIIIWYLIYRHFYR